METAARFIVSFGIMSDRRIQHVDLASLTNATLFMSILLMAIGAGPCSTGGGFKVSTFMVLVFQALSTFRRPPPSEPVSPNDPAKRSWTEQPRRPCCSPWWPASP